MPGKLRSRRDFLGVAVAAGLMATAGRLQTARGQTPGPASGGRTIRLAIHQSPWLAAFQKTASLWEKQTGNKIEYRIFTYGGLLEKTLSAAQAKSNEFDLITLNQFWASKFYEGGFVVPFADIDPNFKWPSAVITYRDFGRWDKKSRWFSASGDVLSLPVNGNIQLFAYRGDLFQEKGLKVPQTWDDVVAAARALHNPSKPLFGYCQRGQKSTTSISWDFNAFLRGHGGNWFANVPQDWTPTINSDKALQALDTYLSLKQFAPPNVVNIGQPEQFTLFQSGRLAQTIIVSAGYSGMDDPNSSTVVDKVEWTRVPKPPNGQHASTLGIWLMGISSFSPKPTQKVALDFLTWYVSRDAQMAGAEAGGIPVRADVYNSGLANLTKFRYMKAVGSSTPYLQRFIEMSFSQEVIDVLELRLNQALVGELQPKQALETMQSELARIVKAHGR